jgi:carboxymethylenebutenolidase
MHDDAEIPQESSTVSRRTFVVTSLAVGFAAAIQPVSAATITTDANGLVAGEVKIPVKDGEMPAYRALPEDGGPFPVVLVVEEIFGVHEHIKDICRRLAKLGYMAIAPELFARHGDVSKIKEIGQIVSHVVSKVADAEVMSDLDATVRWAAQTGKADTDKLGITGFCWGGRIVWLYAAHNAKLKAGVAWYGPLVGKADALHPKTAIELAPELKAPVLGLYGGADTHITAEHVDQMREALKAANKPGEIIVFPGAPHGFNADYRASYHKEAAEDGWKRMQAWFEKYGAAPSA